MFNSTATPDLIEVAQKLSAEPNLNSFRGAINGVRVELYDDWTTPFLDEPIVDEGIRLATLKDLAAFKLDAIVGRLKRKTTSTFTSCFKHRCY